MATVLLSHLREPIRILQSLCANDEPIQSDAKEPLNGLFISNAPAQLNRCVFVRFGDSSYRIAVDEFSIAGTVQIHQM